MTRRNMALAAGGRDLILAEISGKSSPRVALRAALKALKKQDLLGYARQYEEATGIKPYAGLVIKGKAVRSPTVIPPDQLVEIMVDAEFPKKAEPKVYTKAELEAMKVTQLRDYAKTLGMKPGPLNKRPLIEAILKRRGAVEEQRTEAREAGRLKLISGKGLKRRARKKTVTYDAVRHGKGPYRYAILRAGKIVIDAGPYMTAREATIQAKALLRTKGKAFVNPISQADGQALVAAGRSGFEPFGRVVDGYVMKNHPGMWEAFIYQPHAAAVAYGASKGFENLIGDRTKVQPMSLQNLPEGFVAAQGKIAANSRRRKRRNPSRRRRQRHSDDQLYYQMQTLADMAVKDFSSHRGSKSKAKAMIKDAYNRVVDMHESKAAGRRNLGGVSDWYDAARDM